MKPQLFIVPDQVHVEPDAPKVVDLFEWRASRMTPAEQHDELMRLIELAREAQKKARDIDKRRFKVVV